MTGLWLVSYLVLWCVVVILALVSMAILRQLGFLYTRLPAGGARTTNLGPEIGKKLEPLQATTINGKTAYIIEYGRPRLLLFVSPNCGSCEDLMPAVRSVNQSDGKQFDIVLLTSSTDREQNQLFVRKHRLDKLAFIASEKVVESFSIQGSPYALCLDAEGVVQAKGIVNHMDHLESLFNALATGHPTMESYVKADGRRTSLV